MTADSMHAVTRYIASGDETSIFRAAWENRLPLLLKGPTGCGKTKFVQTMAQDLQRPLFTVACHEDLTAGDLVGRFLLRGGETVWEDGPLTRAVRQGGICYLDEIVEARADTTVVIHPLADHRRELNIERLGESLTAPQEFMLVMSYNPGYQSVLKDLKPSTRQRMIAIDLAYPTAEVEVKILMQETQVKFDIAQRLVTLGHAIRALKNEGLQEGASTRTLIAAARLIGSGISPVAAAGAAIAGPLSDDPGVSQHLLDMAKVYLT
jgi:nitric oxide reductase NorQ protein